MVRSCCDARHEYPGFFQVQNGRVVYLIGEDAAITEPLAALLKAYEIRVHACPDAESFLGEVGAALAKNACVLSVEELPGMNGLSLLDQLRAHNACLPMILMTTSVDRELNRQALQLGATDVIDRPLVKAFLTHQPLRLVPGAAGPAARDVHDGPAITFRAIAPDDADIEQDFVRSLSDVSKNLRFFSAMKQLSPKLLRQFTHPSFPGDYALIATTPDGGAERQIGVARYLPTETAGVAEFAVVVADDWHRRGIASRLMHGIICIAAVAGVKRLDGIILRDNLRMLKLARDLGFTKLGGNDDPATVRVSKSLDCSLAP